MKNFFKGLICFVVLVFCFTACSNPEPVQTNSSFATNDTAPSPTLSQTPTIPPYISVLVPNSEAETGQLVIVNYQHEYKHTEEINSVSIPTDDSSVLLVEREGITLPESTFSAIMPLAECFFNHCNSRLCITSGYRTEVYQSNLYAQYVVEHGEEMAKIYVASPGMSEHHTGLAIDLSTIDPAGQRLPLQYHPEAQWFNLACTDYGFILRYPIGTEAITHIEYEPWHFRYVGVETAHAVTALNMTYEEYIEHIKQYSIETGMLFVDDEPIIPYLTTDENGGIIAKLPDEYLQVVYYSENDGALFYDSHGMETTGLSGSVMWYVPASDGDETELIIPRCISDYMVYGTNCGGFIVIGKI